MSSFNPLHRGMGVLTLRDHQARTGPGRFQSSTSRHGGTDYLSGLASPGREKSFNPLHRGMGVLTRPRCRPRRGQAGFNPLHRGMGVLTLDDFVVRTVDTLVSILYIEAWGY